MRVYSREQFHELVWSRPMTELSKEFGLSDVALHKICRRHDVPNPPPGWWAKKTAGKKVVQARLPKLRDGISDRIVITGGELRREPEVMAAAREKARVIASSGASDDRADHPIIRRTVAQLRRGKRGPTGLVSTGGPNVIKCETTPASVDRLGTALRRITAAVAQQGFELGAGEKGACFVSGEESVGFSISETYRRVKHELTQKELAEEEKWKRKRERQRLSNSRDWISRPRFPEWDYVPTGQLSFELEYIYCEGSPRRTFRDGKVQRLEDMAGEIAVGIVVLAAAKTQVRLDREAARLREQEQRRLRDHAMRAKHIEDRRAATLDQILGQLDRVERIERLLTNLRGRAASDNARLCEFIRWAHDRLRREQDALTAGGLAQRFEDERAFGDDDDHAFQPPFHHVAGRDIDWRT